MFTCQKRDAGADSKLFFEPEIFLWVQEGSLTFHSSLFVIPFLFAGDRKVLIGPICQKTWTKTIAAQPR